jgi:hypothetical protein
MQLPVNQQWTYLHASSARSYSNQLQRLLDLREPAAPRIMNR